MGKPDRDRGVIALRLEDLDKIPVSPEDAAIINKAATLSGSGQRNIKFDVIEVDATAQEPQTREEAEREIVREMVAGVDEILESGDTTLAGFPCTLREEMALPLTLEEMRRRIARAALLGGASPMRIGQALMRETDPKKN